jgi:DNA-binding CsgD family transcriptional regulator
VILFRTGRVREAKRYLDVGERAAREHALDTALFRIEAQQCHVLLHQGSWDEAERRLRRLLERAEDPGANLVNPLAFLGRILARRGDPEAAALIDRSWRLASATGEDQKMAIAAGARIEQIWLSGDDAAVRAVGAQLLALAIRAQNRYLRAEILRYLRRVGEPVEPFDGCLAPFAAGIEGDWAAAASGWERIGNPYHQALELTEAPELEAALRGLGMLDRLGAVATASLVRRRLRRGGTRGIPRGPRAATRANPGRLTDRQLEVLALLAEGSTNAEIAARLYLSRRTVDNHVAAVLARLGVSSRHDALQAATALGLLAPPGRET